MNASDCAGFTDIGPFLDVMKEWRQQPPISIVYLIVVSTSYPVSRRVRHSQNRKGDKVWGRKGRLWQYRYAVPSAEGSDFDSWNACRI